MKSRSPWLVSVASAALWASKRMAMSSGTRAILRSGRPCCIEPKNWPGPRSRKSSSASLKPSETVAMILRRSRAFSVLPSETRMQYEA